MREGGRERGREGGREEGRDGGRVEGGRERGGGGREGGKDGGTHTKVVEMERRVVGEEANQGPGISREMTEIF